MRYGFEVQAEEEGDCDMCWRDKILSLKFGESPFDSFLTYVRDIRPPLHRALSHHPLVTAKHKPKRKVNIKSRLARREKRDRPSLESDTCSTTRGFKRKFDVYDIDSDASQHAREDVSDTTRRAQLLGAMVAKGVVEGSLQGQLVIISVLMYELLSSEDKGVELSADAALPVGNVLAALFETNASISDLPRIRTASEELFDGGQTETMPKLCLAQCNPFRSNLRMSRLSSTFSVSAQHASVTSRDAASVSTDERQSEMGSLDAPSNVGSLQAEMGTETASVTDTILDNDREGDGGDEVEEEEDDDELLAQALAMSMGSEAVASMTSHSQTHTITSANLPALSESSLSRLPDKRTRIPSPTSQTESVHERAFDATALRALSDVHPLSTFGPFCHADYWRAVRLEAPVAGSLAGVSVENTITALLVNIAASVDVAYEGATSAATLSDRSMSRPSHAARTMLHSLGIAAAGEGMEGADRAATLADIPLTRATPLTLHPVTFLVLEMLFDMFLTALTNMPSAPRGRVEEDASVIAWRAKRTFLVYGLTVLLKLLGAQFRITQALGAAPYSVGLVRRKSQSSAEGGASSAPTVVDRLLKIVIECIGTDIVQVGSALGPSGGAAATGADDCSHALRLLAIDTLAAGYSVFFAESAERESLLLTLLRATSVRTGVDESVSPFNTFPSVYSFRGCMNGHSTGGAGSHLHTDTDYYRSVLLQKICALLADGDWVPLSGEDTGGSGKEGPSEADRPLSGESDGARIRDHLRARLRTSMSSTHTVMEGIYEAMAEAHELGGGASLSVPSESLLRGLMVGQGTSLQQGPKTSMSLSSDFINTLECELIHRLGSAAAIMNFSMDDKSAAAPNSLMLWGEMCLLFKLQQRRNYQFSKVQDDSVQQLLEFDGKRSSKHIKVLGDRNSVTHTAGKSWATAMAVTGCEPGTGEHTWAVRLDRCDKGHVFVGMATASAGLETYVGGDKHGWGIIGTRDLWHNGQKVKSKFGAAFSSKSVVYVRYDSNQSTISFSSGNMHDFEVAFSNIPKTTLFPAVSLYQRDDRMTLIEATPAAEEVETVDGSFSKTLGRAVFAQISPAVVYALAVFDKVEAVIDLAERSEDIQQQRSLLSHPFLTALLPSLVAAVAATKASPRVSAFVAVQLLPHVTMLTKRLAALHETLCAGSSPRIGAGDFGFIGDISGDWCMDSTAAGSNIQAQRYLLALQVHPCGDVEGDSPPSEKRYRATRLTGSGCDPSSVEILGTLYGTRIRFLETWNGSGKCLIDCRMALDGYSFCGNFKDMKSGSTGTLVGIRQGQGSSSQQPYNLLLKTAMLSAVACGRLAAHLVQGLEPVPSLDVFDLRNAHGDGTGLGRRGVDAEDISDSKEEDEQLLADSKDEVVADNEPELSGAFARRVSVEEATERWVRSSIFSGGLKEDAEFIGAVGYQLRSYMSLSPTTVTREDKTYKMLSSSASKLKSWWLEQTFSRLPQYCTFAGTREGTNEFRYVCASVESPSPRVEDSFLGHLQNATGMGKRIDDHMTRHTGMSMLCKVGGDTMQAARRRVLASLLYHSGCVGLCYAEDKALSMEDRDESDKPHPILTDIWRAGQKIIEHAIRRKQAAGVSYGFLSQELSRKADFFMTVRPNAQCQAIMSTLASQESLPVSPRWEAHNDGVSVLTEEHIKSFVSRRLAEMVEFFQSATADITHLRAAFFQAALRALSRTAGLRALQVLLGRASGTGSPNDLSARLPSLTSLLPQPFAVECIHASLYGMGDGWSHCDDASSAENGEDTDLSLLGAAAAPMAVPGGHFLESLQVVSDEHVRDLRTAFEGTYELITQMLQRCTWAGDRDGQCVALAAWDISIIPADHAFLNRIGIFRLLQTVLDDTRAAQTNHISDQTDACADPYSREMKLHADRRLTERALQIVHTLASQVAYCKDGECATIPSLTLQRHPSGPETLSQALFDMLYAELFNCFKQIIGETYGCGGVSTPATEKSDDFADDLQGDNYAYRILRLLFSVSDSPVCQRYLSTPKWLTLLVSAVGFGGTSMQRQLLRLMSRLLMVASPETLRVYTGDLFVRNEDMVLAQRALDEDDVEAMISAGGVLPGRDCAERLLALLLRASTVPLRLFGTIANEGAEVVAALLDTEDGVATLTAECISILRALEYVPGWRNTLVSTLRRPLLWVTTQWQDSAVQGGAEWSSIDALAVISGVMGVLGGHVDRMRVGGTVTLRPFSLASTTDSFAFRLAGISHSTAMLVSRLTLTNAVEVVLMERCFNSIRYSTSSGSLPIRPAKISKDDVLASPDILPCADFFDAGLLADCLAFVQRYCLPLAQQTISKRDKRNGQKRSSEVTSVSDPDGNDNNEDEVEVVDLEVMEDVDDPEERFTRTRGCGEANQADAVDGDCLSELQALQIRVSATSMRALADLMQSGATISCLTDADVETFRTILDLAVSRVSVGGLAEIEALESRWAALWEVYPLLCNSRESEDSVNTDMPAVPPLRSRSMEAFRAAAEEQAAAAREATISSNMLASLLGAPPSAAEANRALEQMMEMEFPREWCEVALRRCRYNVEMAINLCFEHGPEMNQIVAEEAALASAARSGSRGRVNDQRDMAIDLVARLTGRRPTPAREPDSASNRLQLQAMGFAPALCQRALEATGNDLDNALAWMLMRRADDGVEDAMLAEDEKEEGLRRECKDDGSPPAHGPNPLSVIGGTATVSEDLCVGNGGGGFPSVGCRGYHVSSGKWYYEITLETAGCMQFGWADLSYEGGAEHGEGVGDDAHSWAYDGWRKLKWNHVSAEWGAKWAIHDVVGCLLDMDNRKMAFTLNGFGSEIDMGLAFEDFTFFGGVYPCVSFNRQEKMRFNFGHHSFKHPPIGYTPFAQHVQDCLDSNILKLQALLTFKSKVVGRGGEGTAMEGFGGVYFEDCLEEQRGEGDFLSHKRYFHTDETSRGEPVEQKVKQAAGAITSAPIPDTKAELLREFESMSVDLCVLYARLIVLRLANAYSRDSVADFIVKLLQLQQPESNVSCVDKFMHTLRESSACSLRTKIYLHTVSILSPGAMPPQNLGSVLTTGGAPLLSSLQNAMSQALHTLQAGGNLSLGKCILEQIHVECVLSTRREYAVEWKVEGSYTPVIYQDSSNHSLKKDKNIPSLILAVWLSSIMVHQMVEDTKQGAQHSAIVEWIQSLVTSWTIALKSPVIAVKLCASRVLNNLIQEIFFGGSFPDDLREPAGSIITASIPLDRLEKLVLLRMEQEKGAQPICSEYLQCMIELAIAVRVCANSAHDAALLPDSHLATYPQSQAETNDEVSDFNWDAICGSLLSDDGWEVWSGSVRQLESPMVIPPTPAPSFRIASGKNENPPALLPGCKVARMVKSRRRGRSESERSDDGSMGEERRTPRGGLMQLLSERLGGDTSDAEYEVGTVTEICAWPNGDAGTARRVLWADGEHEVVRWGVDGEFDVAHVVVDARNKVQSQYPYPSSKEKLAKRAGFASDTSFGVLLRLRSLPASADDDDDIQGRFDGLMEWPDFKATVYVTGVMYVDGQWTLVEEKIVGGSKDADWTARFGQAQWQAGTTYDLSLPRYSESEEIVNSMGRYLLGQFHYPVTAFHSKTVHITGDIRIQQSRLFTFDKAHCASSVTLSHDQLAAACGGGEGKCCVYATVGFSTGVHYWEYKIERCDLGNIFVGVAEKTHHSSMQLRFNKWPGYGFINLRASHRNTDNAQGDHVYGDIFQTGDTVGVLLDMNRGRLSFFLDAMKYGEHLLTDLGEAFDSLTAGSSLRVQQRTFFPVVGFRRAGDRVAITPRWISSSGGQNAFNMFRNVSRAWNLLSSWSEERPSTMPQGKDLWTYREAWRDWLRWKSNRFIKVRARCRALNLLVGLDIGPRACVDASIRLGLPEALFHGDRIVFSSSCGRPLETKEEAVILGSYRGQLWYRFDSQSGDGVLVESSGLAWCLAPDDIENMKFMRRGVILSQLPAAIVTTPLARIPVYRGGLLRITYSEGAVIRQGLEIDASDAVGNVASGALVWALERRMSSSNIARYLVHSAGTFGWISERIRGGSEEFMVRVETAEPPHVAAEHKHAAAQAVSAQSLPYRVHWEDVQSPAEAMRVWEKSVREHGFGYLLERGQLLAESYQSGEKESFEDFLALSTTMDGTHNWPVECDMLLTDFLSRVSSRYGQSPFNITCSQVISSVDQLDVQSPLRQISADRILARAAVIRCANVVIGYALPYLEVCLPEDKWKQNVVGNRADTIGIVATELGGGERAKSGGRELVRMEEAMRYQGDNYSQTALERQVEWKPPCGARRLRSKRRVLFTQTKGLLWENILEATTTPTPLPQDEYEDPREIKMIKINRVKATQARLGAISSQSERIKQSVFGQLHREMRSWPGPSFRRSYLGKGHGGQKRAFKVTFMGEGVNVSAKRLSPC